MHRNALKNFKAVHFLRVMGGNGYLQDKHEGETTYEWLSNIAESIENF